MHTPRRLWPIASGRLAVVQRACIELEAGRPEVALLSSLLQTQNVMVRKELYERSFAPASRSVQRAFTELVAETQLELEKRVLRGESVEPALLQSLRVISLEAAEYDADDVNGGVDARSAVGDDDVFAA